MGYIKFNAPVKHLKGSKERYFMDDVLISNLNIVKKASALDWDFVFCVDGIEGVGKSIFSQQLAYYLDPTIDISRVCFSGKEFIKACINAKQYQAVIFDEAITGSNIRETMNEVNIAIMRMLGMIRQKKLYIIIVLPSFYDIDRYIALWRSRAVFHIYAKSYSDRGYFMCYKEKKNYMWIRYRKYYYYGEKYADFRGIFTNVYTIPEEEYRKKKADVLLTIADDPKEKKREERGTKWKEQRDILIINLKKFISAKEIAKLLELDKQTIYDVIKGGL